MNFVIVEQEPGSWVGAEVPDGELPIRWRIAHDLLMDFQIYGLDDDEVEIEGSVKWDGCINWSTSESCAYHFCEPLCVDRLARAFDRVWKLAAANIPKWWDGANDKLRP